MEQAAANRDVAVVEFRKSLMPMRMTLKTQPYLGGDAPNYADYIVFGPFQWARATSAFKLLTEDDPIYAWREKLLDAFGGVHGVALASTCCLGPRRSSTCVQ